MMLLLHKEAVILVLKKAKWDKLYNAQLYHILGGFRILITMPIQCFY